MAELKVNNRADAEFNSFFKNDIDGKTYRRVGNDSGNPLHTTSEELVIGVDYDLITASYPNTTTEIYIYTLVGSTVLTATVTYTDSTKRDISTASFVK